MQGPAMRVEDVEIVGTGVLSFEIWPGSVLFVGNFEVSSF